MRVKLSTPSKGLLDCEICSFDPLRFQILRAGPRRYLRIICRDCGQEMPAERLNFRGKLVRWTECSCGSNRVTRVTTKEP